MQTPKRVVERYYGRDQALRTALNMEYQGQGWLNAIGASNAIYAEAQASSAHTCQICGMEVDEKSPLTSVYKGRTYCFCRNNHKAIFDASPEKPGRWPQQTDKRNTPFIALPFSCFTARVR
jgi:YHS domain-containing protein